MIEVDFRSALTCGSMRFAVTFLFCFTVSVTLFMTGLPKHKTKEKKSGSLKLYAVFHLILCLMFVSGFNKQKLTNRRERSGTVPA